MRVPLWELMQRSSPTNNSWLQTFRKVRSYFLWCKRVAWLSVCCFIDFVVFVTALFDEWPFTVTLCHDCGMNMWDDLVRWPCAVTLSNGHVWSSCMTPCMMDGSLSILQTLYMPVFVFVSNLFVCVNFVLVRLCLSAHSVPFRLCVSFYLPSVFLPCLPTVSD